jgi:hypothetical protein
MPGIFSTSWHRMHILIMFINPRRPFATWPEKTLDFESERPMKVRDINGALFLERYF